MLPLMPFSCNQIQVSPLLFDFLRALLVPQVPLGLLVQVVVVMTLASMGTSTGLTSPAQHLLSDRRIMKSMPL